LRLPDTAPGPGGKGGGGEREKKKASKGQLREKPVNRFIVLSGSERGAGWGCLWQAFDLSACQGVPKKAEPNPPSPLSGKFPLIRSWREMPLSEID